MLRHDAALLMMLPELPAFFYCRYAAAAF